MTETSKECSDEKNLLSQSEGKKPMQDQLDRIQRRLRALTVAVIFLALAVLLCAAAVYGSLVNYFGSDVFLFGGTTAGATLLGFGVGWFARGLR